MSKLERALEKLRALPEERQEYLAQQLIWLIEDEEAGKGQSLLTDEQWAEVEAALADEDEEEIPHERVVEELRKKYPK